MADASTAEPGRVPARSGSITLVRHGEPAISRKVRFNAASYGKWWTESYEPGSLRAGQQPPAALIEAAARAGTIIASTRVRSIESATLLTAGRAFAQDPLFIEAPLPGPPWPSWVKLSPKMWGFWSRFWWWFLDHHAGQESRKQAEQRADEAAAVLEGFADAGQDVLLVAHGFFNVMIGRALAKRRWRKVSDGGFRYWNAKRYER
jgi:broad specificity phosphatase PhoE